MAAAHPDGWLVDLADRYYRSLDSHDYDALESILDPAFVQNRPDRIFEGRDRFVEFMRDERPDSNTDHRIDSYYQHIHTASTADPPTESMRRLGVLGEVVSAEGERLFSFVDIHYGDPETHRINELDTFVK